MTTSIFESDDLLHYIFQFLTPEELLRIAPVSKRFLEQSSSNKLWKEAIKDSGVDKRLIPTSSDIMTTPNIIKNRWIELASKIKALESLTNTKFSDFLQNKVDLDTLKLILLSRLNLRINLNLFSTSHLSDIVGVGIAQEVGKLSCLLQHAYRDEEIATIILQTDFLRTLLLEQRYEDVFYLLIYKHEKVAKYIIDNENCFKQIIYPGMFVSALSKHPLVVYEFLKNNRLNSNSDVDANVLQGLSENLKVQLSLWQNEAINPSPELVAMLAELSYLDSVKMELRG